MRVVDPEGRVDWGKAIMIERSSGEKRRCFGKRGKIADIDKVALF
jgi:hypothetical protein